MNSRIALMTVGLAFFGAAGLAQASLITNGGFENVPNGSKGQGLMPSDWVTTRVTPDTYSNDGSYGLAPSGFGNFTGVSAHEGLRWVAAWSSAGQEGFGQWLGSNLISGVDYTLSGWLHQSVRRDLDFAGGYEIYLTDSPGTLTEKIGFLGSTTNTAAGWVEHSFSFTATDLMASLDFIEFAPIVTAGSGTAYPGLDSVSLVGSGISGRIPEPNIIMLMALGLAGLRFSRRQHKRC